MKHHKTPSSHILYITVLWLLLSTFHFGLFFSTQTKSVLWCRYRWERSRTSHPVSPSEGVTQKDEERNIPMGKLTSFYSDSIESWHTQYRWDKINSMQNFTLEWKSKKKEIEEIGDQECFLCVLLLDSWETMFQSHALTDYSWPFRTQLKCKATAIIKANRSYVWSECWPLTTYSGTTIWKFFWATTYISEKSGMSVHWSKQRPQQETIDDGLRLTWPK